MNEFEIIDKLIKPLTGDHPYSMLLSDDACILDKEKNKQFVITTDVIAEGVHFFSRTSPSDIAYKLLAVNLSDIAAMGAIPRYYLVSAVLSKVCSYNWLKSFCDELMRQNKVHRIVALGGDTVKWDKAATFSVTMIGEVDRDKVITRSGAKVGDDIYVTGFIGDSSIGLAVQLDNDRFVVNSKDRSHFINKYLHPVPRVNIGHKLIGIATSMIDVSDGLLQDALHISRNSNVCMEFSIDCIPLSRQLSRLKQNYNEVLDIAITGGDDYELLFTAPSKFSQSIRSVSRISGVEITKIGQVKRGNGIKVLDINGKELKFKKLGYTHI